MVRTFSEWSINRDNYLNTKIPKIGILPNGSCRLQPLGQVALNVVRPAGTSLLPWSPKITHRWCHGSASVSTFFDWKSEWSQVKSFKSYSEPCSCGWKREIAFYFIAGRWGGSSCQDMSKMTLLVTRNEGKPKNSVQVSAGLEVENQFTQNFQKSKKQTFWREYQVETIAELTGKQS